MGSTESTARFSTDSDHRIGRLAVGRGHLTDSQLRNALAEQSRGPSRRLGEILVARGFLTESGLRRLLREQKEARAASPSSRHDSSFLGRILAHGGQVTLDQIDRCLKIQEEEIRAGVHPAPRLGEILVREGLVPAEVVAEALARQRKTILSCPACGLRLNTTEFNPAGAYPCSRCGTAMSPLRVLDDVRVSDESRPRPDTTQILEAGPEEASGPPPTTTFELGKYTILRQLGQGGMGVVFEALDTSLDRKVALKMLVPRSDAARTREDEQRFLREARLTAALPKHPHLVGIYEAGIINGRRYIAMEYIQGVAFDEWRRKGAFPAVRQVEVLRDAALAVHHAHEHGVVHRDLKPGNILVDARGVPHLADFGLAMAADRPTNSSLTDLGVVLGTPAYMSPEQARGESALDRRTDVYSLGVMLFEVLSGRVPFQGRSMVDLVAKLITEPVPRPSAVAKVRLALPHEADLELICLAALAKDRNERTPTALALADQLTRWLKGDVPPPEPSARPSPRFRPRRRRRRP